MNNNEDTMASADTDSRPFDFDEPVRVDERVADVIADNGGFPEDNPFTELVEEHRDNGATWTEIASLLDPVAEIATAAAAEEQIEATREWDVVTVANEHDATSVTEVETHSERAATAAEAEAQVREKLPEDSEMSVDSSRTTYNRVVKE